MNRLFAWIKGRLFYYFRTQLIIFYTVCSLIVLSIGSYFSYSYIVNILKDLNERYILQQFQKSEYNINAVLSDTDRLSKLFILDDDIQKLLMTNLVLDEYDAEVVENHILTRINNYIFNYSYINSIYLYTNEGAVVGGSELRTIAIPEGATDMKFYTSRLHKDAYASFPKSVFDGGYDETYFNENILDGQKKLISISRAIKPIYGSSKTATLVFNIDEQYIASIYSLPEDLKQGYMYITNAKGVIISSVDGKGINQLSRVSSSINKKLDMGQDMYKKNGSSMQIIYYRLKNTGWYLVVEVPMSIFYRDADAIQKVLVTIFLVSMLVIIGVSFFWLKRATRPLVKLSEKMRSISKGQLGLQLSKIPENEFGLVIQRFNEMSVSIEDLMKRNEQIYEEKRTLEIEALQAHINPHFIYNTLNMIKWMASVINAKNIVNSIVALGNILRATFRNTDPMCRLKEEIEYLENYLKIMNLRYGNNIQFTFNIDESVMNCRLPRFILQPIIENSIMHGMTEEVTTIMINVYAALHEEGIQIVVSDTGKGMDTEKLVKIRANLQNEDRTSGQSTNSNIGLKNVHRRIILNFGERYGVFVESELDKGTRISINLPRI